MTLSRVIVEIVVDGGGHFSPASYRWFTHMSLLFSSYTAHNRADILRPLIDTHTPTQIDTDSHTESHTKRGYSTSLDRGV